MPMLQLQALQMRERQMGGRLLTAEQIAEIRARCDAATQGPWYSVSDGLYIHDRLTEYDENGIRTGKTANSVAEIHNYPTYGKSSPRLNRVYNAEFIAHTRQDIPALLDALEAAEAGAQTLQIALDESVKLLAHEEELLNMHDGGRRMIFKTSEEWIARLVEVGKIKTDAGEKDTR